MTPFQAKEKMLQPHNKAKTPIISYVVPLILDIGEKNRRVPKNQTLNLCILFKTYNEKNCLMTICVEHL